MVIPTYSTWCHQFSLF